MQDPEHSLEEGQEALEEVEEESVEEVEEEEGEESVEEEEEECVDHSEEEKEEVVKVEAKHIFLFSSYFHWNYIYESVFMCHLAYVYVYIS